ncbi:MAG: prepilin peptidase [Elusimicrobia bacterium]|nr:prepilin peptidase [Elusimicrobiota bacterium]
MTILAFTFGLIIGSFLNVCIYRLPRGKSIVFPSSGCPVCGVAIKFYDNIPVLSFIFLKGLCRNCNAPISWRYPLIELLSGALTALFFNKYAGAPLWCFVILVSVYALIVLSFIDLEFMIIPDELSLGMAALGLLFFWANPNFSGGAVAKFLHSFFGAGFGFAVMWLLAVLGEKLFKKEAMGGGDLKLMAGIGAIMGLGGVLSTLMIGSVLGSVYGICLLAMRKIGRKAEIPFGPFLSMAALINFYHYIPPSAFLFY